jgi:hypothetical protein
MHRAEAGRNPGFQNAMQPSAACPELSRNRFDPSVAQQRVGSAVPMQVLAARASGSAARPA